VILNDVLRENRDFAQSLTSREIALWCDYFSDAEFVRQRKDLRPELMALFKKFPVFVGTVYRGAQDGGISEFFRMDEARSFREQMGSLIGQTFVVPDILSSAQEEYAAVFHGYKRAIGRAHDHYYEEDWEPKTHSFLLQFNNAVGADVDEAFNRIKNSPRSRTDAWFLMDMWHTYREDDGKEVILFPGQRYKVMSFSVDDEEIEHGTRRIPTGNRFINKHRKEPVLWPHSRIRVVLERS